MRDASATRRLVLVLSQIFFRGGIPRFNQMLCMALDELAPELGLEVTVLSLADSDEDYRDAGSPWKRVRFVSGRNKSGLSRQTLALCRRERPDLLLIGLLGMTPLGPVCRPWVRGGFGFIVHGFECWPGHPLAERRWTRKLAARRARFVLSVSDYTRRKLVELVGIRPEAIQLLPNTLEPNFETFQADPHDETPDAALEILTVARLWAEETMKGVDHTLTAFARLAARHPRAHYRVVGKGTDKPRLQRMALELGLEGRVTFDEDLSDAELAGCYRRCALFALPSGQEGFGIVFLEAMRFSKPCIGGDTGGTPEVVAQGRTGLLVPFGDVDALEAALDRLLGDPALRASMGAAGRLRLLDEFSFDRFRLRVREHLLRLLPR